ncbi:MAG: hypothetical protein ACE5OZ_22760 [Candidatus Heimdallarchaeota archaeon]
MELFFKSLFPWYQEWLEEPFAPWSFGEGVLLTVLSFFEYSFDDSFSLRDQLQCPTFMDSGAFSATAMGFALDPYEVAEMHSILKADFAIPLDLVITIEDSEDVIEDKISQTLRNTEILLNFLPSGSEVIGPIQGLTPNIMRRMFDALRELGITKFALGGVVFQSDLSAAIERIQVAREITKGYWLHVFGKFLHPRLLKAIINLADSVDGYGYILSSTRGLYIRQAEYQGIGSLSEAQLAECSCSVCSNSEYSLIDFQRGDREAQHLLIQHNINALIALKEQYLSEVQSEERI